MKAPSLPWGVRPLAGIVAVAGLVLTGGLAWAASSVNRHNEASLLHLQVRQAASAVTEAVPSIQTQLLDSLEVAVDTGDPAAFKRFSSSTSTSGNRFATLSLWEKTASGAKRLALVGETPHLVSEGRAAAFFATVKPSPDLQVTEMLSGPAPWLGYAEMAPGSKGLFVYAESLLPERHHAVVPRSSAFNDLNFAIYFGARQAPSHLVEASVPTPVRGTKATATVPFGNTSLTLVGTPTRSLTGGLSSALVWIVLGVGCTLAALTASTVEYILRRRGLAETLAAENEKLYVQQRDIAGTLQHALLPELPKVPDMELAARYLPGVAGIEVGGDWYDVIASADRRCFFVVGDVSGRGLAAATTMASLRFSSRAYMAEGAGPGEVLARLSQLMDIEREQRFATVLVGEIDLERQSLKLANSGHLPPLVVDANGAHFVELPPGLPVGIGNGQDISETTIDFPPGSMVLAYTDGLVERRDMDLQDGLSRLRQAAARPDGPLEVVLDRLSSQLIPSGADDDIVLLGLRWPTGSRR